MPEEFEDWSYIRDDDALDFIYRYIGLTIEPENFPFRSVSEIEFRKQALQVLPENRTRLIQLIEAMYENRETSTTNLEDQKFANVIFMPSLFDKNSGKEATFKNNLLAVHEALQKMRSDPSLKNSGWPQAFKESCLQFSESFPLDFILHAISPASNPNLEKEKVSLERFFSEMVQVPEKDRHHLITSVNLYFAQALSSVQKGQGMVDLSTLESDSNAVVARQALFKLEEYAAGHDTKWMEAFREAQYNGSLERQEAAYLQLFPQLSSFGTLRIETITRTPFSTESEVTHFERTPAGIVEKTSRPVLNCEKIKPDISLELGSSSIAFSK